MSKSAERPGAREESLRLFEASPTFSNVAGQLKRSLPKILESSLSLHMQLASA